MLKSNQLSDEPKETLFIIKIGGNVIDDAASLDSFLKEFAAIDSKKILVHGGGKIATRIGDQIGIESTYINGRRITDDKTIDLVTMVYGGLVNKKMVSTLQSYNANAIGLTGADGNLILATKRPVKDIDYGWVGDIDSANINNLSWKLLLDAGFIPVVAPLTHDGKGHILNTNADTIASAVAVNLSSLFNVILIYCFEKKGVLENISDEHSVISLINRQKFEALKMENKVAEGILPKIENALNAIDAGVNKIIIGSAADLIAHTSGIQMGTTFYK